MPDSFRRHLLQVFLGRCLAVAGVILLIGLLSMFVMFQRRYPHLALRDVIAGLPDALLILSPLALTVSLTVGTILFARFCQGNRALLAVQLAGRTPLWAQRPIIVVAGLLSLLLYPLQHIVIPQAYSVQMQRFVQVEHDAGQSLLRLVADSGGLGGLQVAAGSQHDGWMRNVAVSEGRVFMCAHDGRMRAVPERQKVDLQLRRGHIIVLDEVQEVVVNATFDRMDIRFPDPATKAAERNFRTPLKFLTTAQMRQLPAHVQAMGSRGALPDERTQRRLDWWQATVLGRSLAMLLPFGCVLICLTWMHPYGRRDGGLIGRDALLAGAWCLLVVIPAQVWAEGAARHGRLSGTWQMYVPAAAIAVGLLYGLWRQHGWLRGRR